AACIAGIFSLEDGLKLVANRGRLMQEYCDSGAMLSVSLTEAQTLKILHSCTATVSCSSDLVVATVNGPESVVVSGTQTAIEELEKELEAKGVESKKLRVSHAFHSPMMEPMLAPFAEIAGSVRYNYGTSGSTHFNSKLTHLNPNSADSTSDNSTSSRSTAIDSRQTMPVYSKTIPIYSNLTGSLATEEIASAGYWVNHVKSPVRFAQGIASMLMDGYRTFIEIGPKPILCALGIAVAESINADKNYVHMSTDSVDADKNLMRASVTISRKSIAAECRWLPSLRYGHDEQQRMLESLGHLWVNGADVNWEEVFAPARGLTDDKTKCHVRLPNYPFQHRSYWIDWLEKNRRPEKTTGQVKTGQAKTGLAKTVDGSSQSGGNIQPGDSLPGGGNIEPAGSLLGDQILSPALPDNTRIFSSTFDRDNISLLAHHRIFGSVVMPAAAHVEIALEAGLRLNRSPLLKNISIHQALVLQEEGKTEVQTVIKGHEFKIYSRSRIYSDSQVCNSSKKMLTVNSSSKSNSEDVWTLNSSGEFDHTDATGMKSVANPVNMHPTADAIDIKSIIARCSDQIPVAEYYEKTHGAGIEHGEKFRAMTGLWHGEGLVVTRLELPESLATNNIDMQDSPFQLHPVLLDAAFQTGGVPMLGNHEPYLPVAIDYLYQYRRPPSSLWCVIHTRQESGKGHIVTSDLDLVDDNGNIVASVKGLHFQRVKKDILVQHLANKSPNTGSNANTISDTGI
ncbi:MAG: polyketide synthase dehydratase domain-containing protein, partial [Desulfamplus sp.]|nr:polyketide synthase dehydratase domain-containing protein [Desulfamplus sp.]